MAHDKYREEAWNLDFPLPSPKKSSFILDIGNYMIKAGFSSEEQPRLKILNLMSKNKSSDGNFKIGQQIQYIELLKQSVQHPFQNGILVYVTVLQQILTSVFVQVIGNRVSDNIFPYKTIVLVPYGQPQVSLDFINDLFLNCFNCKNGLVVLTWDQLYQRLYNNTIIIHLGHVDTDVYSIQNKTLKQVKRILIGQQQLQAYFRKLLSCSYGNILDSISYTQLLDFIYEEGRYLSSNSNSVTIESNELYIQMVEDVNKQIHELERPEIAEDPLTYDYFLQNSINAYKLYSKINNIQFIHTEIPYQTLYNQNSLVALKKMVEKYQKQTLQKLLNLIKPEQSLLEQLNVHSNVHGTINMQSENKSLSETNSNAIENQSTAQQSMEYEIQSEDKQKFITLLQYLYEQLALERRKQKSLGRSHIQTMIDHVLEKEEYQNVLQVIDIHKLTQYQSNIIENLQFAFDSTLYLLRYKYKIKNSELPKQLTKYTYLPIAYHYENVFCNENKCICIPVFLELIYTYELLFNTQQMGIQQQSLDEILNEFLRNMEGSVNLLITGGGANIKNVDKRIFEAIKAKQRINAITTLIGAKEEWQMIVKAVIQEQ